MPFLANKSAFRVFAHFARGPASLVRSPGASRLGANMAQLTPNAVQMMVADAPKNNDDPRPILQVIDIRRIGQQNANNQPTADRWRVVLSDGVHLQQTMLATQLNELITSNTLKLNNIVRVEDWMVNFVQGRK